MSRVTILGMPIDALTMADALVRLRAMLASSAQNHVMTPNSEMLVEASRNPSFAALLHRTALNLPDSAGLLWAARHTGQHLPERVTGVDTVRLLCAELGPDDTVYLLGAGPGVADKAAMALQARNADLRIVGTYSGSPSDADAPGILAHINAVSPRMLLVAYGAPQQDVWIDRHLAALPSVRVAMGVGGTFDFLAGTRKRAPLWLQRLSLEWLWRLVREPRRFRRIFTAVVVFPWIVLFCGNPKSEARNSREI